MKSNTDNAKILNFQEHGDERGKLVVIEGLKDIPFEIKRIFYIYGSDSHVVRGCHANKKSEFVMINICGTSKIKVKSRNDEKVFILDKPYNGVYLPAGVWKEMYDFSADSILLVLASELYDPDEYIRIFEDYIKGCDEE